MRILYLILFTLFVCINMSVYAEESSVVTKSNTFAFDLYKELRTDPQSKNIFLSPYSIYTALGMTYAGATGVSEKEFKKVLHINEGASNFHADIQNVSEGLLAPAFGSDRYKFSISNAIWINPRFEIEQSFIDILAQYYDAAAYNELSVPKINAWAEEKTGGKITHLLSPSDVDADTVTILTNAAYFLGFWQSKFDEENTSDQAFYGLDREDIMPLMYQKIDTQYFEDEAIQAISLGYDGSDLAMAVILPKDASKEAFDMIEDMLDEEFISKITGEMSEQEVDVFLPRFEMKYTSYLKSPLNKLGLKVSVTSRAEFCGMYAKCKEEPIWIKDVVHQAYIKVDEAGTEAAAATAVIMTTEVMAIPRTKTFRADHPFIYFIYDKKTGVVLFLGRMIEGKEG